MYKVFFNSNQITFGKQVPQSHIFTVIDDQFNRINFKELIQLFIEEEYHNHFIKSLHPKEVFEYFCSHFKIIEAAGGVVFNEENEVLFIHRLGKWDLPKGKLEKGENIEECAIREVQEECGITDVRITSEEFCTYHSYLLKGKKILKKTHWYKMEASKNQKLTPQTEEDITEVKWLGKKDLKNVVENTYENILLVLAENGLYN